MFRIRVARVRRARARAPRGRARWRGYDICSNAVSSSVMHVKGPAHPRWGDRFGQYGIKVSFLGMGL